MGKADNIRRAKKLKEAKRKREMDALPFVDLGPAAKAMVKRKTREGATMRQNNGEILYSNLLYQYLTPILSDDDEFELFKVKIVFGIFTWNAAILREKNEEAYITAKGDVLKIFSYQPDAEKLFEEMVKHKDEEFSEYKKIIQDFELKKIPGDKFDLSVATIPLAD